MAYKVGVGYKIPNGNSALLIGDDGSKLIRVRHMTGAEVNIPEEYFEAVRYLLKRTNKITIEEWKDAQD